MTRSTLQLTFLFMLVALVLLAVGLTYWSLQRGRTAEEPPATLVASVEAAQEVDARTEAATRLPPSSDLPTTTLSLTDTAPADSDARPAPSVSITAETSLLNAGVGAIDAQNTQNVLRFTELVNEEVDTLNPILTRTSGGRSVARKLYPQFLTQDAQSGALSTAGLATGWAVAEASDIITFTLAGDYVWSDGVDVTAKDAAFTINAILTPAVDSPYRDMLSVVATATPLGDDTVVVTLEQPDCSALYALRFPVLPSHIFADDYSDLATSPLTDKPIVSSGPFRVAAEEDSGRVVLTANADYRLGEPSIGTYVIAARTDASISPTQILEQVDLASLTVDEWTLGMDDQIFERTDFADDSYSFLALNLAAPDQPQAGRNGADELQEQTPHPILGDLQVRRALAAGLDYDAILRTLYGASHYRTGSYVPPTARWVHNGDLAPYASAPTQASQLLDAAGWRDDDGDGVRSRSGTPLTLTLLSNNDSPQRMQIAELVAEQLRALGFSIRPEALPFDAMTARVLAQEYDLAVLGWDNLGAEPGVMPFWHSREDVPGRGFNFVSFQDAEIDALLDEARTYPGCDSAARSARYRQIQQRIYDAVPYIIIGGPQASWLHRAAWSGIEPGPWAVDHNIQNWQLE